MSSNEVMIRLLEDEMKLTDEQIENLKKIVSGLKTHKEKLFENICLLRHGVAPGKTVWASFRGSPFEECIVDEIDTEFPSSFERSKPWIRVRRKKKDGDWSSSVVHAFNNWRLTECEPK